MKRLLKGGRVVDPANGIDGVRDVLIDGDRIARVGRGSAGGWRDGRRDSRRLRDLPWIHRHARAPARAGAGAQGNHRNGHGVGCGGRLHRGRLHAEHDAGQRRCERHDLHPGQGEAKRTSRGCIRSAPCRSGSKGELLADIAGSAEGRLRAPSRTTGIRSGRRMLLRRALEYAGMFGMPVIEHCEDPSLKGDGVAHEGYYAASLGLARHAGRLRGAGCRAGRAAVGADRLGLSRRAHERARITARGAQGARRRACALRARSRRITSR